jgi:spore coat polysaccharide biosynthesis protein SpsF
MLAIIQARASSRRLPGKVLRPLAGRTILGWVASRVGAAQGIDRLVVATSTEASDDSVVAFCQHEGITCHRGPLDDVAERFAIAADAEGADAFLRITGDSPLIDPAIVEQAVQLYQTGEWDLVSNVLVRSFPKGQSVEVLRTMTFNRVRCTITDPVQREHVTQYYYSNPKSFRILSFTSGTDASAVQLSVDTAEDFIAAEQILAKTGGKPGTWRDLVDLKSDLA